MRRRGSARGGAVRARSDGIRRAGAASPPVRRRRPATLRRLRRRRRCRCRRPKRREQHGVGRGGELARRPGQRLVALPPLLLREAESRGGGSGNRHEPLLPAAAAAATTTATIATTATTATIATIATIATAGGASANAAIAAATAASAGGSSQPGFACAGGGLGLGAGLGAGLSACGVSLRHHLRDAALPGHWRAGAAAADTADTAAAATSAHALLRSGLDMFRFQQPVSLITHFE